MENKKLCQSCSMPLDKPELLGTEKDGSPNQDYCSYCYQHGAFVNPNMTLDEMKAMVIEQMGKRKIDNGIIGMAVNSLPYLKRWNKLVAS